MPKNINFSGKFDMKITDQILAMPQNFPPLFSEKILKFYTPESNEDVDEKI